jgi:peptidyl-prolyl cis-trans isomerase B (cyclophilin B)
MADEKLKTAWDKSEKILSKGNTDESLKILRDIDPDGEHATTLRIAGEATWAIGKKESSKSEYRKAASLLRDSVKKAPRDKKANASYNSLLNELQDKGIKETRIPRLINDGTPTVAGIVALVGSIILVLFMAKFAASANTSELATEAYFHITWTDSSEQIHDEVVTIELFSEDAPKHVENLQLHAEAGNYDDTPFHRVISGFMIQGGDFERGDGTGGYAAKWYGYCNGQEIDNSADCAKDQWTVPQEHDNGRTHVPGSIAAAHAGTNTDGSQFYIVPEGSIPSNLDYTVGKDCSQESCHTVYGQVIDGLEYITSISEINVDGPQNSDPVHPVTLVSVTTNAETPWWKFW